MKKYVFTLVLLSLFTTSFGATNALRAYLSHASFYAPEHGPYVETYLSILGKSVQFVRNDKGKFQGTVMVTMLFKQNDSIKGFRKYDLLTTEIDDTTHINFIVFDQQRIALPAGNYDMELQIADKNRDNPPFNASDIVSLNFDKTKLSVSGIELIESFSEATETSTMAKSGYDFIPYQDNFFPQDMKKIAFYAEIYNSAEVMGSETPFVVTSSIQSIETGKPMEGFFRVKRETTNGVNVIFNEFDISELPSGNFKLVISVRDKENKEITSQSSFIQRSNPGLKYNTNSLQNVLVTNSFVAFLTNTDTLREYIRSCFPIASANEKMFINNNLKAADITIMQQFFYAFWEQRSPADPAGAWEKYYNTVLGVEKEFGSIYKKGYETDRGRIYLQYGPPNQRDIETMNPDSFPYEIWHIYTALEQTNLKFVFYTRDKALNDYILLHSTAIGEVKNVTWQYDVKRSSKNLRPNDIDNELYNKAYEENIWGEHTGDYYNIKR